ncbi:unnamed protein product [Withania somnifera]
MAYQMSPGGSSGGGSASPFAGRGPYGVGDTTYTKVFVGGLAWETKSESLRRYFEQFGDIIEAVVITDKHTGRSKGYGFVTFHDPEAAWRACANPNPIIDGRRANCNLASLGRPQGLLPYGRLRSSMPYLGNPQAPRGLYMGSPIYQLPVPYSYQPGFSYPHIVKVLDYPLSSGITMPSPQQSQTAAQAPPQQFTQSSGSEQMAG